jgi:cobalt-zinc-cadmium efflux system membrane fusion protein
MRASFWLLVCISSGLMHSACSSPAAAAKPPADIPQPQQDGVVRIREASRPFIETETISTVKTGQSVAAPARVDFRDGAVSQLAAPLDGRIVKVHVRPANASTRAIRS